MGIFLTVLGIIGLVLLGILALILLLLLIVFLGPVSYRIFGSGVEGLSGKAGIRYYGFVFRVLALFQDKKLTYTAKLFKKNVAGNEETAAAASESEPSKAPAERAAKTALNPESSREEAHAEKVPAQGASPEKAAAEEPFSKEPFSQEPFAEEIQNQKSDLSEDLLDDEAEFDPEESGFSEEEERELALLEEHLTVLERKLEGQPSQNAIIMEPLSPDKQRPVLGPPPPKEPAAEEELIPSAEEKDGLLEIFDKIFDFLDKAMDAGWELPDKLEDKIESMISLYEKYRDKWEAYPDKRKTVEAVKKLLVRLLRPLLPKKLRAKILFGTGDPALTAQILGYYYAAAAAFLPAKSRKLRLEVQPDLEEKAAKFDAELKGHFLLGWFIPPLLAALCNPAIWRLIRFVKTVRK